MIFWLVLLAVVAVLSLLWFVRFRQRTRDWYDSQRIFWRRKQAVRLRLPQLSHNIVTILGKPRRRDIDFVYQYAGADALAALGPKDRQDPSIFDYQGAFTLLNYSEKRYTYAPPLFTLTYTGGRAYEYYPESAARYDNSDNPYASRSELFVGNQASEVEQDENSLKFLLVEADYSAPHYRGDCLAIYAPIDEHAYDSSEGVELVFVCAWQSFHKERYNRVLGSRKRVDAWRGDILLYFPGRKWERLLPIANAQALALIAQKAYESSLIHQDSLRRRFLYERERRSDEKTEQDD